MPSEKTKTRPFDAVSSFGFRVEAGGGFILEHSPDHPGLVWVITGDKTVPMRFTGGLRVTNHEHADGHKSIVIVSI